MIEFDPGPNKTLARHLAAMPSYSEQRELFWYDWGPIFYRGRLNGSAKLLAIASDPGPTERIAGRTLVGDAGPTRAGLLVQAGTDALVRACQRLRLCAASLAGA